MVGGSIVASLAFFSSSAAFSTSSAFLIASCSSSTPAKYSSNSFRFSGPTSVFCASISSLYFPSEISFNISFGSLLSIRTPRAWQVPITDFTDAINVFESRLECFAFAIEITCSIAKFPTFCFNLAPDAFSIFNSFFISSDVGGDRTLIENSFVSGLTVR